MNNYNIINFKFRLKNLGQCPCVFFFENENKKTLPSANVCGQRSSREEGSKQNLSDQIAQRCVGEVKNRVSDPVSYLRSSLVTDGARRMLRCC
jgi:hypothetical protein